MPKSSTPNSQLDRLQERELARGLVKNDFIQDDVSDDDEEEIYITPNAVHKVGAVKDDEESEGASEPENADDFDDNDAENNVEDDEDDLEVVETGNVGNAGNDEVGEEDVIEVSNEEVSGSKDVRGEPEKRTLTPVQNPVRIAIASQGHDSGKNYQIVKYLCLAFLIC